MPCDFLSDEDHEMDFGSEETRDEVETLFL